MTEAEKIAAYCRENFDLTQVHLGDEFFYRHLPLCIVDTVYGLGNRYSTVVSIVERYCAYTGLTSTRLDRRALPSRDSQQSVSAYRDLLRREGTDYFASEVFRNRRPASPRSTMLRSESSVLFAEVLLDYGVDYWQEASKIINNDAFDADLQTVDGIAVAGVKNFAMLVGNENTIKPDVWILRFLKHTLHRKVTPAGSHRPMRGAATLLGITARELDHEAWKYMREHWETIKRSK